MLQHATWDGPVPGGHQYTLKNVSVFTSDTLEELTKMGGHVQFAHNTAGDLVVQCTRARAHRAWTIGALLVALAILVKDVLKEYTGRLDHAWTRAPW